MKLRFVTPLVTAIALGALLFWGIGKDPTRLPSPLVGKPTPAFALPTLADPTVTLTRDELLGQPYLLNVFASWCVTCRQEHPILASYARTNEVRIIGLNWKDTREDATRWLAQFGNPYQTVIVDETGSVGVDLGVYGTPETFLIGPDGVIAFKHVGLLTPEIIDAEIRPRLAAWRAGASS